MEGKLSQKMPLGHVAGRRGWGSEKNCESKFLRMIQGRFVCNMKMT